MITDWIPEVNLKVTPQTIIWFVGARNVVPTVGDREEYEITSSSGVSLRYKSGGKRVEAWVFSGSGHKTHPESVKLRPFLTAKWVPMSSFVIPGDEIPGGLMTQKRSPGGSDKSLEDTASFTGHIVDVARTVC